MSPTLSPQLVALAIQEVPALIARIKELLATSDPAAPVPTDAEVIAAYTDAFQSSLAKDDQWLAAHPASS